MTRLIALAALVLVAVCAAGLLMLPPLVGARSFDVDMAHLLASSDVCGTACWQGITVNVTTREDALRILEAHPWVGEVFNSPTQIAWHWSGQQPALIDSGQNGLIGLGGGLVRRIRLQTHIRFGQVWQNYGAPDTALLVRPVSRYTAFQIAHYEQDGLYFVSLLRCPVLPGDFWSSTTTLGMGDIWTTEALNSVRLDIYESPGWWSVLHPCRGRTGR
jgi:hypothetical protein